ncbi:MAG TPA: NepR family anti-sigma factor [Beijerinckiaceae bacterium]|jgi:hypothetical protein
MATRTSRTDGFGRAAAAGLPRPGATGRPTLDPDTRDHIGAELRAMYAALASEPVPDRFVAFLEQLGPIGRTDVPKVPR